MKHSKQNKMHMLKEKFMTAREWVMDHNKIVMPLVLVVCVQLWWLLMPIIKRCLKMKQSRRQWHWTPRMLQ